MTIRLSLLKLSQQHRLSVHDRARLLQLGAAHAEPPGLDLLAARGIALLAAGMAGLALIFWIAANWAALGRFGSFALLQSVLLLAGMAAWAWPRARSAAALVAFGAAGGLLAYFGQTYQTGADPWQLFAWWAVLTLPLCMGVRRDALWAPWAVVASCAIALWIRAHTGAWWNARPDDRPVYLLGWAMAAALLLLLSPVAQRWSGAGVWALRLAALLSVALIAPAGAVAMFDDIPLGWLAVAVLAGLAWAFARGRLFDVFILSTAGLGLNLVLVCAAARLFVGRSTSGAGAFLAVGLCAAALLGLTVKTIATLKAQHDRRPAP